VDINVSANDVIGDAALDLTSVSFVSGTEPNPTTEGVFTVDGTTGVVTFTPVSTFVGTATIDYTICDANALCDVATISVVVTAPTGPTAIDDDATTKINTPVDIDALDNDNIGSAALDPTSVTFVSGTEPNPTTEGTFTVHPTTGLVTFTPVSTFVGTATIDYNVCDANNLCDDATITVVVSAFVGPTAVDDNTTTEKNTPVNINALSNDIIGDAALDPTSVTFVSGTEPDPITEGTFTVNSTTGLVTFTPVTDYLGTVTIDYNVCDANSLCDDATITVNIIDGTTNLYPATGFGTLAYEDLWPGKGDYDFNDIVVDYQFKIITNTGNFVENVEATFIVKATGASYENGFGFQLSSALTPADITVSGYSLKENIITLDGNGTEAGQSAPTIIVFDNIYQEMTHPGIGIGINTEENAPYVTPATFVINMVFKPNTYTYNQLDISNFNPFIIVNLDRSVEVHLPDYPPTDLADQSLFGNAQDDSNPSTGRYYKTENNLPWAIHIYESFDYPLEKQEVVWAYLKFAEWAESNGSTFTDWYQDQQGYRDNNFIYTIP